MGRLSQGTLGIAAALSLLASAAWADDKRDAFTPGEQTTFTVHYLGMKAGMAQVTVGAETNQWGHAVWPIVTEAKTQSMMSLYTLREHFVTYWESGKDRSIGSDLVAEEGHSRRRQRIVLDHDARTATVIKQKEGERPLETTAAIDPGTADIAAAIFALRNQPLEVGRTFEVPVFTGAKSFTLKATVEGKTTLKTALGMREVFKVRGITDFSGKFASKRDLYCYLTTDPSHLPVKLEAEFILGSIIADVTDYKAGNTLALK